VGGTEEELVGLLAGQQGDVLVRQLKPADVPALVAGAPHQPDRVGAELLEMTMFVFAARNSGHDGGFHDGIPSSRGASSWRSLLSANGASGWSSMFAMKPPRGVSATNVMARARSAARRK